MPFNIIHLDDDEAQLEFAKIFLERDEEIKITSTNSTSKALELLLSGDYDCIVSDYKMPNMNGIEFAKKVRETSDIPLVLYTGQGSEEVAEAAFAVGIDDYVRKENDPSHYQVLAKRIISVIEKRRGEEKYRTLFESMAQGVTFYDSNLKGISVNPAAERILGVTKAMIEDGLGVKYHKRPLVESIFSFLKDQYGLRVNNVRGLLNVSVYALLSVLCCVLNREAAENVGRPEKALSPTFFNT